MDKRNIDRAIDDLSDEAYERLSGHAVSSWRFRIMRWPILIGFIAAAFACFFILRWFAKSFWPGSYVAMAIAAAIWIALFFYSMNRLLSLEFSHWLVTRAIRREFQRGGSGAP